MSAAALFENTGRGAILSGCGIYRYALERWWDNGLPSVLFVMLNPSTADGTKDDPTIRRCIGFARSWGYGGLLVGNLFAYRATDPRELPADDTAIGPENAAQLDRLARRASLIVAAWGGHKRAVDRAPLVAARLGTLHALDFTRAGAPRHPLYVTANARPIPFAPSVPGEEVSGDGE